jgi:putative transposase
VASLSGKQMYMWRAVDGEGEVLEILVQPRREKAAAMRLLYDLKAATGQLNMDGKERAGRGKAKTR